MDFQSQGTQGTINNTASLHASQIPYQTQIMEIQFSDGFPIKKIQQINLEDQKSIVSSRKKKKRQKISNSLRDPLQIDSKQLSVQQLRSQIPKPCIVLQPQSVPFGYAISLDGNLPPNSCPAAFTVFERLPDQILREKAKELNPNQIPIVFAELMKDKDCNLPQVLQMQIPVIHPEIPQNQQEFQNLFKKGEQKVPETQQIVNTLMNLAQTVQNTEVQDGQVLIIPQQLGQIVTNQSHLLSLPKMQQICQQFLMITFFDLITFEQEKFQLRTLIKSNYKQQICKYIQKKIKEIDPQYNYQNVQILKMINSLWIWDNVMPFMAESVYRDCGVVRARLLPERCNNDSIVLLKYHVFLIMSEMFFGLLPGQLSTYDLPISFGQIMTIGTNDSALVIENKKSKLRCLLHYFSAVLREKEENIKSSVEFIGFQRFRVELKHTALFPQDQKGKLRYKNLKLTDHIEPTTVKFGNQYSRETALYLTHQNPCRESGQEHFQTSYFMEETYRLMYAKPQIFILKALTPKLDLGEAIIVHGLQQFNKCFWKKDENSMQTQNIDEQWLSNRRFCCDSLFNQQPDLDAYGKRKGTVILIMSKLLFGQTYINNDHIKYNKLVENYSISSLIIEIETLYSAFQGRKMTCNEEERILISQRYIKFIEDDCRWVYFILVWIAASLARVKVLFQFQKHEHRVQAFLLMRNFNGRTISSVFQQLANYRDTLIQAHNNMEREVQKLYKQMHHDWNTQQTQQQKEEVIKQMEEIRQNLNEKAKDAKRVYKLRFGIIRLLMNAFFLINTPQKTQKGKTLLNKLKSHLYIFLQLLYLHFQNVSFFQLQILSYHLDDKI